MKKSIFFSVVISLTLLSGLFFTGCENFLNGGDIKDKIEKEIYIANNDCPVATVEEPVFSDGGVAKNKSIIVSFTKAIKPETFAKSYKITDSQGKDLTDHFLEPKWSNNNKLVTIVANEQNYIDLGGKNTLDIYFTVSNACETPDELPIKSAINHKYRINNTVDNTPPEMTENVYAERASVSFSNTQVTPSSRLAEGAWEEDNEWQICLVNHINSKINIYFEGNDYGGGVVRGHVYYHRITDVTGRAVNEPVEDFKYDLTKAEDSDLYSGFGLLDLSSQQEYQDGLYEIKVCLVDSADCDSENYKVYSVIRDTTLAYCVTSLFVNDTPLFRAENDIPVPQRSEYASEALYKAAVKQRLFDIQTPTLAKINDFRTRIMFWKVEDDVYYTSALSNNTYAENEMIYFVSWGTDLNALTEPVRIDGKYYDKETDYTISPKPDVKYYNLPDDFVTYLGEHKSQDIILKATVLDSVGNQNVLYSVWPKQLDFYNYHITSQDNGKKTVKLHFSDLQNFNPVADKAIRQRYRIFYAPLGNLAEDADFSNVELKRNADTYNGRSDEADLLEIKDLDPTKYIVFIQSVYDTDSTVNGQYNGTTFGPAKQVIIDTRVSGGGTPKVPKFDIVETNKGDTNSGLYTLRINITDPEPGVKYVPYFKPEYDPDKKSSNGATILPGEWTKFEAQDSDSFSITIKNPLRMPIRIGEAWYNIDWDKNEVTGSDNNYHQAVANCYSKHNYPDIKGFVKIVAVNETESSSSIEKEVLFKRDDDNIPPKVAKDIICHDSRLSYDGHSFEFSDIIREDEGNLSEYFNYYYTPYNYAWGDNLSVLSNEQINMLPGGVSSFTGSCWIDNGQDAEYRLDLSIPVYGLSDGDYMFFAKVTDTYGNYSYVTLGKAHIGTFKNKLKVKLDDSKKHFISTLDLEADERYFQRNMINVQALDPNPDHDNCRWWDFYSFQNELQECSVRSDNGKVYLYNHNIEDYKTAGPFNNKDVFFLNTGSTEEDSYGLLRIAPKELSEGGWYRLTVQSFNENYIIQDSDHNSDGVDRKYGRPYNYYQRSELDDAGNLITWWERWNQDVLWWVDGETKYDVCTEETVSNTVYYYVPGQNENLSDLTFAFFPSNALVKSNHDFIVNVVASSCDLGNDIDEWERRGKIIKTHFYKGDEPAAQNFDYNQATQDLADSHERGTVYYRAIAHFANNEARISDVYTMYGF